MTNTSMMRSSEPEALLLQQQEQKRVNKAREQIFRRHRWEALERDRRRVAAQHMEGQEERVVAARCPVCGEILERTILPMQNGQSVHNA